MRTYIVITISITLFYFNVKQKGHPVSVKQK